MKITINVDIYATVPNSTTEEELEAITLNMKPESIKVDGRHGEIKRSKVLGYCTQRIDKDPR